MHKSPINNANENHTIQTTCNKIRLTLQKHKKRPELLHVEQSECPTLIHI